MDPVVGRNLSSGELRRLVRAWSAALLGVGGVFLVLWLTGWVADSDATLDVMGFDPDRARLISSLVVVAIAVAVGVLAGGPQRLAVFLGLVGFWLLFGRTFLDETSAALVASGPTGTFDPGGWLLTVVALVAGAMAVGWAAGTLAAVVRRWLVDAIAPLRRRRSAGRGAADLARAGWIAIGVAVTLAVVPVLGDALNYAPDARMRTTGGAAVSGDSPAAQATPEPPGSGVAAPSLTLAPPATVLSKSRPWLAWRPSGAGTLQMVQLPAPWRGGRSTTARVAVYLPPGYGLGTRTYPVVYEVPWDVRQWQSSIGISGMLDNLIDSGSIAPEIVVFVSEGGGPIPDAECADTRDGREWFETYVARTIVPWVDSTYRTMQNADARALLGFSQGGFCSAMLLLRHPDVFGQAIAFSGYFQAGIKSAQTPNAYRPFGGDAALEAQLSPLAIAPDVPPARRRLLFVELSANPIDPFYGAQYQALDAVLKAAGIPDMLFPTPLGHAWAAIREQMPSMLETLAARQAALGVFAS